MNFSLPLTDEGGIIIVRLEEGRMRIVDIKEVDIEKYLELRCKLYPEPLYTRDEIYEEIESMFAGKRFFNEEEQRCSCIVEEDGRVTALIEYFLYPKKELRGEGGSFFIEERHIFIESLITDEDYRRRGYSRELIKHAYETYNLPLYVDTEGEEARRFYESIGFQLVGENRGGCEYILRCERILEK